MTAKEFLAKLLLGRDINEDFAMAEKENREVQGKYNNACQTISVLEEENIELSKSLDASKQKMTSLQSEKDSTDALLSQLLNDDELSNAKTAIEDCLEDKKKLYGKLVEKLHLSKKEHDLILKQLGELKEERTSLENDVNNLSHEIKLLKENSEQRDTKITDKKKLIAQRKGIRDTLLTLKDKWLETLDDFKTRMDGADTMKSLEGLKRELEDYERRVNNAIEISVK